MAGTVDRIEGKAKELKGKLTGDKVEEAEGKAQQVVGKMKDKMEDAREEANDTSRTSKY